MKQWTKVNKTKSEAFEDEIASKNPLKIKVVEGKRIFVREKTKDKQNDKEQAEPQAEPQAGTSVESSANSEEVNKNDNRSKPSNKIIAGISGANEPVIFEADGMNFAIDVSEDQFTMETESDLDQDEEQIFDKDGDGLHKYDDHDEFLQGAVQPAREESIAADSEIQFGASVRSVKQPTNEAEAAQLLSENLYLGNIFKKMIKQGIQEEVAELKQLSTGSRSVDKGTVSQRTDQRHAAATHGEVTMQCTPGNLSKTVNRIAGMTKSPSDTTVYSMAMRKIGTNDNADLLIDKISNFVEEIHFETTSQNQQEPMVHKPSKPTSAETGKAQVVEAEQFNASLEALPKGMHVNLNNGENFNQLYASTDKIVWGNDDKLSDDNFFHLTCQVDNNLKERIERGEYVELE